LRRRRGLTGGELLVARRCWRRVAPGRYENTPLGTRLTRRAERLLLDALGPGARVERLERPALRPGPRQLVAFSVAVSDDPPGELDAALSRLARVGSLYRELAVPVGIGQVACGFALAAVDGLDGALPHTQAATTLHADRIETAAGVEAVLVAVAALATRWPAALAPTDVEVWRAPRGRVDAAGDAVNALRARSLEVELVESRDPTLSAPMQVVVSSGSRPYLIRTRVGSTRCATADEVASLCAAIV
jgi:hypothetical protein